MHLLQRGHFAQAQLQVAVLAQLADQVGQHGVQGGGGKTDAQPLALALADTPGVVVDALQLLQHGAGLLIEKTACIGQPQRAFARDQQGAELVFELADLPAQRWLGNVQQLSGAGEVQGFCQDLEVAQVA